MMRACECPGDATESIHNEIKNTEGDRDTERHRRWHARPPQEKYHARFAHAPATQSDWYHSDQEGGRDKSVDCRKIGSGMETSCNRRKRRNAQQMCGCCKQQTGC